MAIVMPWVEATLRGQRVLARATQTGALVIEGGRVEVRYKPNDGRSYRAAARNLVVSEGAKLIPDDAVAPAEPAGEGPRQATRPAAEGPRRTTKPAVPAGAWVAYTDGACSGNPGPAGAGVVLVSPEGKAHEGLEYLGTATNNVAELTAILRAIEWLPLEAGPPVVHTDSQYAIGVLQKGWKAKANGELVAKAKRAVEERRARLVYVPGHAGVPLNERADALAREAITTRSKRAIRVEGL
jgi:ribonuclease HI